MPVSPEKPEWQDMGRKGGFHEYRLRKGSRWLVVRDLGDEVQAVTATGFVKVIPGWSVADAKTYLEGM